ncbi:hypothetical protein HG530_001143 [Fusarium avenaceum]|nr:hypothetical protein HG530_001143 [Fusarium avenaceum]
MTPAREVRPTVGLNPTRALRLAGLITEEKLSDSRHGIRRTNKLTTAVSLSTERERDDISTNSNTATRGAATGVNGQVISAANLTSATRVSLRVVVAAHVSPLAQRSLAEEHGAGVAELLDDVGIAGHDVAEKSPAAGGGLETVFGGDVVFDGEGDAMERTANFALCSFGVALSCDGEGVGVDLQNRAVVYLLDILCCLVMSDKVARQKLDRRELASFHSILHLCESSLLELEPIAIRHGEQIRRPNILLQGEQIGIVREERLILGLLWCSIDARTCNKASGQRQSKKLHDG